jgi:hypothetical protein
MGFSFEDALIDRAKTRCGLETESEVLAAAAALGALRIPDVTPAEEALIRCAGGLRDGLAEGLKRDIGRNGDPLGAAFAVLRTSADRRERGATYTPCAIVEAMVNWAAAFQARVRSAPERIVDPGVGSGRFLVAAGRKFPGAELIGIDIDPVATLIARGNLAAAGFEDRSRVLVADYREIKLPPAAGNTLYVGNPPYVRHHLLTAKWKRWLTTEARGLGYDASQLAGLHVHFFLATVLQAKAGDFGSFITAAEWLDVNYGRLMRAMFLNELGGQSLTVVEPTARPFADAAATAVIGTFQIGSKPKSIHIRRVDHAGQIEPLEGGMLLHRERLESQTRWSHLTGRTKAVPPGFVELGELCRVHRGQVTGANRVWIAGRHSSGLPSSVLFRSVTKARELFQAGVALCDRSSLKDVIDLPVDLSVFDREERRAIGPIPETGEGRRCSRRLHSREPEGLVVGRPESARTHSGNLYGTPRARVCPQPDRCAAYQHRAWTLAARSVGAGSSGPVGRVSGEGYRCAPRPHLRRRPDEVRTPRDGAPLGSGARTAFAG